MARFTGTQRAVNRRVAPEGTDNMPRTDLIVAIAARLFDEAGYANTTMEHIADAVGLAKPTLYHYFRSKSDILVQIHETFIDSLIDKHQRRVASGADPHQQLIGAMSDVLELMETHRGYVRAFFEHQRELPGELRHSFRKKRNFYRELVVQSVSDGCAQGDFAVEDPELAALALFGMCNWAYQWWVPGSGMSASATAESFASMLFHGISLK
jgi:TetR/AcrR family transcriptional regulator, cholesterol catabolism regulator